MNKKQRLDGDLTLGGEHTVQCTRDVSCAEPCAWHLYNGVNERHPNKVDKKEKIKVKFKKF